MRSVDFISGFAGGCALSGVVAFVGHSMVEDIAAEREIEMLDGPLLERGGLECWKAVDSDGDSRDCCSLVRNCSLGQMDSVDVADLDSKIA